MKKEFKNTADVIFDWMTKEMGLGEEEAWSFSGKLASKIEGRKKAVKIINRLIKPATNSLKGKKHFKFLGTNSVGEKKAKQIFVGLKTALKTRGQVGLADFQEISKHVFGNKKNGPAVVRGIYYGCLKSGRLTV